ncbi:MAG: tetratricopeptide repeat protein [Burkholderiales bacterium]|nr:tetratricopeptide repeat protein [Burkholderiales bacterium]
MASALDLQEQEQLDNLKAFWAKWGNLITTLATVVLLAFAGWNAWNWYQREQGLKASVMYEAIEQAIEAKQLDKAAPLMAEMQKQFAAMPYTTQATLVLAQASSAEKAQPLLAWAAAQGKPQDLRDLAQLRLAGLHLEAKRAAEAEKALAAIQSPAFEALVADRRGDLALLAKDSAKARDQYSKAYLGLDAELPYRRLVEAKLMSVGVDPGTLVKPAEAK